jgi:hypothetical protein
VRTYGRLTDPLTLKKTWVVITTDANGFNDMVFLSNLAQVCKLNLNESPFWGDWGIPAHASVLTQIAPDFYLALVQRRFAPRFMALLMTREPDKTDERGRPAPYYLIQVVFNWGASLATKVPF